MSCNAVATDFHCVLGTAEFSFGGCDRQALQDILQFLCGMRQECVPGTFVASWQGERAKYELRGVDNGEIDSSGERGLFGGVGAKSFASESRGEGVGMSSGLADRSAGLAGVGAGGFRGCNGNDPSVNGAERVAERSQGRASSGFSARAGGAFGGVAGLALGDKRPVVTIVRGQDRGPRYEVNKAQRDKRKAQRERKKAEEIVRGGARAFRTDKEQELHDLKVERQMIQERRKLEKLQSPAQMVEDAMRQVEFAEKCAKRVNDSRVAAWAEKISLASAESVAKSAGYQTSVPSQSGSSSRVVARESFSEKKKEVRVSGSAGTNVRGSVTGDGVPYTKATASKWVNSYSHLSDFEANMPVRELARCAHVSVAEVEKYFRLKREFNV